VLLPARSDWTSGVRAPRRNLVSGITVALVALPLALGFGVASGVGAEAGLITAMVAGAIAAIFGGSNVQVSGPTGAMTVVLIPIAHEHGPAGVFTVGLMGGVVLVAAGLLRLGRLARYLPAPVIEGFTAGIALVIALQQVPNALGTSGHGDKAWHSAWDALHHWFGEPRPAPVIMALAVTAFMLIGVRLRPGIPYSLIAVALATVVAQVFDVRVNPIGDLPRGASAPSAAFLQWHVLTSLIPSALAVAALCALESLLSATVADSMTVGQQHDPDRELIGQGLANIAVPFFGGVPATGAIARTAVNVRAGASSRLSALVHAAALAAVVYVATEWVGKIPLAALAGVLLATCVQMVEVGSLRAMIRSTRADALVLAVTFVTTVWIDLVTAVAVGVGIAIVLALRAVSRAARLEQVPLDLADHTEEEHDLLSRHIVAYRIDGPLFFAGAHRFLLELAEVGDVEVVILRMSRLTTIDATGAHVLGDAITRLERRGIVVLISGISEGHAQVLRALGVAPHLSRSGRVFADTPTAIAYAKTLVGQPGAKAPVLS
jgi:SulP family sulfate permease